MALTLNRWRHQSRKMTYRPIYHSCPANTKLDCLPWDLAVCCCLVLLSFPPHLQIHQRNFHGCKERAMGSDVSYQATRAMWDIKKKEEPYPETCGFSLVPKSRIKLSKLAHAICQKREVARACLVWKWLILYNRLFQNWSFFWNEEVWCKSTRNPFYT